MSRKFVKKLPFHQNQSISKVKRNDPQPQSFTIEGHFSSLLISNIIFYSSLSFYSPLFVKITTPKHSFFYFSSENKLCFPDALLLPKAVWILKVFATFHQRFFRAFQTTCQTVFGLLRFTHSYIGSLSTFLISHSPKTTDTLKSILSVYTPPCFIGLNQATEYPLKSLSVLISHRTVLLYYTYIIAQKISFCNMQFVKTSQYFFI